MGTWNLCQTIFYTIYGVNLGVVDSVALQKRCEVYANLFYKNATYTTVKLMNISKTNIKGGWARRGRCLGTNVILAVEDWGDQRLVLKKLRMHFIPLMYSIFKAM